MAYGIGSILGDIDQKADTYRNNPDALAQSYQQNQQLIDLLVLQKLKTDKEAAQRDMQAKMQTPASTIKDQRQEQVMGMTRNEVAQQVSPGLQALAQQQQAAQAQGISSLPAPNMQQVGMAEGGIVAFAEAGSVEGTESGGEGFDWQTLGGITAATAMYGPSVVSAIQKGGPAAKAALEFIKKTPVKALPGMARNLARPAIPIMSAYETATTPTEDYRERFGFDPSASEGILGFIEDLGVRTLGAASDLGNVGTFGLAGNLYRDKQPELEAIPPPVSPRAEAPRAPTQIMGTGPLPTPAPTRGISSITNADNERNIASMLGEDLNVPKVPAKAMERTPSTPQSAYAQQLADLRMEQESKLESLIAFLKGAGGQSSFAATMMGGSDAMNAREAGVKAEIMDVLGKLETIDLKERELGIAEEANVIDREQIQATLDAARYNTDQDYAAAMAQIDASIANAKNSDDLLRAATLLNSTRKSLQDSTEFADAATKQTLIAQIAQIDARLEAVYQQAGIAPVTSVAPTGNEIDADTQAALDQYK
jgi:hypothetical protein